MTFSQMLAWCLALGFLAGLACLAWSLIRPHLDFDQLLAALTPTQPEYAEDADVYDHELDAVPDMLALEPEPEAGPRMRPEARLRHEAFLAAGGYDDPAVQDPDGDQEARLRAYKQRLASLEAQGRTDEFSMRMLESCPEIADPQFGPAHSVRRRGPRKHRN